MINGRLEEFENIDGPLITDTPELIERNINNDVHTVSHPPLPKYMFEYLPLELKCDFCKLSFDYSELEYLDDCMDYEDDDVCVCPHCLSNRCLKEPIEHETITEALKRLKNITK